MVWSPCTTSISGSTMGTSPWTWHTDAYLAIMWALFSMANAEGIYTNTWQERELNKDFLFCRMWFFVASYVVTDNIKLTESDVDNDIPHWEGLEHVKNSLFRSRRSRDGTHSLKWDYFCTSLYTVRYNTKLFNNLNSVGKNCPNFYRWKNKMFHWHFWRPNCNNFSLLTKILWSGILLSVLQIHSNSADSWKDWRWP